MIIQSTKKLQVFLGTNGIASTRAFQSQSNTECYSAAKGGIIALTHALAVSLRGKTRVNAITPGWIDTVLQNKSESRDGLCEEDHAALAKESRSHLHI